MPLYLVNPAVELTLELYVSAQAEEGMTIQWERIKDRDMRATFVRRLERNFERALTESLDWDIKPPTPAQLAYAKLVAAQLGIGLPSEAHVSRFHAAIFLETYAAKAKGTGTPPAEDDK